MSKKKRQDRLSRIIATLQETHGATIRELADQLAVSEMTIRRDLEQLEAEHVVRLLHAGAILAPAGLQGVRRVFSLAEGESAGAAERMRIGRKAASLVEPGDVAILDSGAAAEWLARSLPPELAATVLCYSLNILVEARRKPGVSVVAAGGVLREDTLVFESAEGVALIRRYRANKAFLCAGGVSGRLGVTCLESGEAELRKAALASSQVRILLADSGAFGKVLPAWFADLKDFDAIVTDTGVSLEYVEIVRDLGIALHAV